MNDRFKFRVWHELLKQMHYNDFIVTATGYMAKIYQQDDYMMKFNQEDLEFDKQCILMQCTGLKDKNGKLIYEGNIVKVKVEYENVWGCDEYGGKIITHIYMGKIIFEECAFKIDVIDTTRHPLSLSYHNNDLEVIGNIYENKELLDEQ